MSKTLKQRIDHILGQWPTPDQTREGMLLLAQHLQRHDELVAIQRDIDAYGECRRMPDDTLDALEAHRDRLRREIWEETPVLHLAKEAEADTGLPPLTLKPMASYGWGPDAATKQMDDAVQRWAVELGQRITKDADGKLAAALREHGFVPRAELDKAQAEVAEHRRHVATVMQREDALKKRVEELENERDDAKEQATSLASLARVSKALAAKRAEAVAAHYRRIEELNRRLAERDADSEVGKAIRELRPKEGHTLVGIERITMIGDGTPRYRVSWRKFDHRVNDGTCWYRDIPDAITEYNERKD